MVVFTEVYPALEHVDNRNLAEGATGVAHTADVANRILVYLGEDARQYVEMEDKPHRVDLIYGIVHYAFTG